MVSVKPVLQWSDHDVETEIIRVRSAIQLWAEGEEIWHDAGFSSKLEHSGGEPPEEPAGGTRDFCHYVLLHALCA